MAAFRYSSTVLEPTRQSACGPASLRPHPPGGTMAKKAKKAAKKKTAKKKGKTGFC
jgi:hypothetical protein